MRLSIETYPYLVNDPNILNGTAIIKGTRIPVRTIAAFYQMGQSVDELLMNWPTLEPAQIFSALAYYFDHQEEIDKENEYNNNMEYWEQKVVGIKSKNGKIGEKAEIPA
jgi:uncharacterized protein (DUF433 family)